MNRAWKYIPMIFVSALMMSACSKEKYTVDPVVEDTVTIDSRPVYLGNSPVRLNEIVPVNVNLKDHQGEDPAWLELYNPADTAVNLNGYALTDDITKPRQWVFGDLIVPPKGYQLVYLSGKNLLTTTPATDSINLLTSIIWSWSDGDRSIADGPAGNSKDEPFEFPTMLGASADGRPAISAALTLGDNSGLPDNLTWSSANVGMAVPDGLIDISNASTLVIKGYVQNGRELSVRLEQQGLDSWLGWNSVIKGNGSQNGEYRISLPQGVSLPDLKNIKSVMFEAVGPYLSTIKFTIRDVYVLNLPMGLHTNFKVGRKPSTLWLLDSTAIRDSLAYLEMPAGVAWGYDTLGSVGYLQRPTPWGPAVGVSLSKQATPCTAVQQAGFYPSPIQVELTVPAGASVFYTLDGSIPTTASTVYAGPIPVAKNTIIRSITMQPGLLPGPVVTQSYFIGESLGLPVVSISTPPEGLFSLDSGIFEVGANPGLEMPHYGANFWAPKELPVSVEFFEKDGARAWSQNAGLSIFGNYSRNNLKKAVSLKFREIYGKSKLSYPVFPMHPEMNEFRTLALRANGGNLGSDYIRDPLAQNLAEGLDVDYQRNRPVIVFYNGEYYGIYHMLQKMDPNYPETAFGIAEENVEFAEPVKNTVTGTWKELEAFAASARVDSVESVYARTDSLIDLDEYMNYLALEFYIGNTDWPANNLRAWRSIAPSTKWRWMLFDTDFGFGSNNNNNPVTMNMFDYMVESTLKVNPPVWPNGPASTQIYRKLILENSKANKRFLNRLTTLLSWHFSFARVKHMADSMMAEIESSISRDQKRWDFDATTMSNELSIVHNWIAKRPAVMREQMRSFYTPGIDASATLSTEGSGAIWVDGLALPLSSFTGIWLEGQELELEALPTKGHNFIGWSDGVQTTKRTWAPKQGLTLSARFK